MDGWMIRGINDWMDDWMDGCMHGFVGDWMDDQMNGSLDSQMIRWMDDWMDGESIRPARWSRANLFISYTLLQPFKKLTKS